MSKSREMRAPQPWPLYKPGSYIKTFYDVQVRSGRVYRQMWPNAGYFLGTRGSAQRVPESFVVRARPYTDSEWPGNPRGQRAEGGGE